MPVSKKKTPVKNTTKKIIAKSVEIEDDGGRKDKIKEISREGYQNLTNEIYELKNIKTPLVVQRIKEARSYGDLSENAEYEAAVEEKNMIESRIIEIESLIADAVIIDESSVSIKKSDRIVRYGSIVTVELNDTIHKFKIVSTGEVKFQPEVEVISFNSPVGAAVEGKKIGQTGKVRSEKGRFDIKIIDIS